MELWFFHTPPLHLSSHSPFPPVLWSPSLTDQPWDTSKASLVQLPLVLSPCYCCSITELCPTLCDPINCSMSGFPVLHYHPEFAPKYVHWVSDAIQPSHSLSSPSVLDLSQHQGLFQWVSSSHQVAKTSASASVLAMNIQGWFHSSHQNT